MFFVNFKISVLLSCLLVTTLAAPNPWSPRLKNVDIWGDELESPIIDQSSLSDNDDGGPEIIAGQYSDTLNQTGSRDGRGKSELPFR